MKITRRALLCAGAVLAVAAIGATAVPSLAEPSTTTPFTTPNTDACPQKTLPPAPIDASEVPAPGQPTPAPLPVPSPPIGGAPRGPV
ncbi:hypothetical protein [Nocardia abscessus]|uniref:hypothetical protein n=1 Tax=Nocardia abscessus TaxID=120957 RepID=UPI00313BA348